MDDFLAGIETVAAGKHIADADTDQEVIDAVEAEEFRGDQQGGDGAVGDAAKY